mmetsp:Transcript_49418/g.150370  ORF Transcript_49418/g.150370 Transcript_49418/m.150370 type:complete len:251 (-) Transcript_49418:21-773(-)
MHDRVRQDEMARVLAPLDVAQQKRALRSVVRKVGEGLTEIVGIQHPTCVRIELDEPALDPWLHQAQLRLVAHRRPDLGLIQVYPLDRVFAQSVMLVHLVEFAYDRCRLLHGADVLIEELALELAARCFEHLVNGGLAFAGTFRICCRVHVAVLAGSEVSATGGLSVHVSEPPTVVLVTHLAEPASQVRLITGNLPPHNLELRSHVLARHVAHALPRRQHGGCLELKGSAAVIETDDGRRVAAGRCPNGQS